MKNMPEVAFASNSDPLFSIFEELVQVVSDTVDEHLPVHEFEQQTFQLLLTFGRRLQQRVFDRLGDGDLGGID